mmetsp:Transcript_7162/g.17880  ORF Transcript_7162/g.17880 Transcript_7162/m.17880 type:complete len:372 (+) Transcript_7162:45-1160(+)
MSKEESGASEIFDVVLYMFVLGPAVEWCLKSPKVNKGRATSRRGILLAVLLLSSIAGAKLSYELIGRESNHFVTLGVRVDATPSEVRKAYMSASIKYHPDKNPDDPKAGEKFMRFQAAYDVLKVTQNRDLYNKFGTSGLDERAGTSQSLMSIGLFYAIWLVVGYLLTMGKGSEESRTWAFSGLLALAVYEYQCRILSIDYSTALFPYSTVNEKIELLHKLFPPYLHGSRMISQVLFRDVSLYNKLMLEEMHRKIDGLGRLAIAIKARGNVPVGDKAAVSAAASASAASASAKSAAEASADAAMKVWSDVLSPPAPSAAAPAASEASETQPQADGTTGSESASRNRDRMQNIVCFFVVYAFFKHLVDSNLFA